MRHCRDYELDVRREVEALTEQGIGCDVLFLGEPGEPWKQTTGDVTLRRLPGSKSRGGRVRYLLEYGAFVVVAAVALAILHARRHYRVIQVNTMPDFLVLAAAVPKMLGVPIVVFMQEPTPELAASLGAGRRMVEVLAAIEQRSLRFADEAITVTEQLRSRYLERGADPARVHVVLNGPDPQHLLLGDRPPTNDRERHESFSVLCHGTIEDRYGHDTLLDAVAIAVADVPSIELVISGKGSGTEAMLARIEELRIEDHVRYEGWVSDQRLAELLRSADVGVVAQKASPYSHLVHTNKMYDFWIAGLPVVASRLEATAADFDDSTIAYFEPDDPADLARQLVRLASSRQTCVDLADAGRRAYERVGWHSQKERYLDVYRRLLPDVFTSRESGDSHDRAHQRRPNDGREVEPPRH